MEDVMSENIVWIDFDTMEKFMVDVFTGLGVSEEDAAVCADVLITADKRGIDSHGINRLKPIYYDRIKAQIQFPKAELKIVKERPASAVIDGGHGMGMVVAKKSMELAIEKARKYGIGMVAVRNSTHYGICGYYALMAAKAGMVGLTGTNARPSIAPTFGIENMLGTNPFVVGFPTNDDFPFCIDCATSVSQRGKIEVYARGGKTMPPGWVINQDGETKTNAEEVLQELINGTAALTPLGGVGEDGGGYKGYGYATVVEVLSAALQAGSYLKMLSGFENGKKVPYKLGHFFIAVDIESFTELDSFKKIATDILDQLRASKKMPGQDRIFTAGEKEYDAWLYRKDKGVPINKSLQNDIVAMRDELNISGYYFPF
ncbi:MAG: Ldh family oxidoreductase [bacterium]|nr:Ldh family oxidoreductase [bacterium]